MPVSVRWDAPDTCTTGQLGSSSGAMLVVPEPETSSARRFLRFLADVGAGSAVLEMAEDGKATAPLSTSDCVACSTYITRSNELAPPLGAAPVMVIVCAVLHWRAGTLSVDGIGGGGAGEGGRAGDGGGGGDGQLSVETVDPSLPMDLMIDEPSP